MVLYNCRVDKPIALKDHFMDTEIDYRPYDVRFTYANEANTVLVAPNAEAAGAAAKTLLARSGITVLDILGVSEIDATPQVLN
jgi:hypothetical protein